MSKLAVIYWTGTGNTGAMAQAVAEGAAAAGAQAELFQVSEIGPEEAAKYDRLALGCSAMGAEVLEEAEFEPFFTALEGRLSGKKGGSLRLLRLGGRSVDAGLVPAHGGSGSQSVLPRGAHLQRGPRPGRPGGLPRLGRDLATA